MQPIVAVLVVLAVLALLIALAAIGAFVALRRLRRPIELSPRVNTGAPLRWRWSLSRSALLHRRLVLSLASVRLAAATAAPATAMTRPAGRSSKRGAAPAPWQDLVDEAERLAADLDRRLVVADAQPRGLRYRAVAALEPEVDQVEEVCSRLVGTVSTWAVKAPGRSAAELLERISAIDAAMGEIRVAENGGYRRPVPAPDVAPDAAGTSAADHHDSSRESSREPSPESSHEPAALPGPAAAEVIDVRGRAEEAHRRR